MTRRLPAAVLGALLLTGCSTVPSSSPTVQITQEPGRTAEAVGIEPLEPEEGATPEEIVRDFIDAAASTTRGHPIARMYLAPAIRDSWSDEAGITIVASDYATVTTEPGRVVVSGDSIGTVDPRGTFAVGAGEFSGQFALEEVDGEWRISSLPLDGLLMAQPDFERLYDERAVYFLDPTLQRVVPDPRYLIQGEAQPTALVDRLLAGPAPALGPGVENPLAGATLVRAVIASGQSVRVDLAGIADRTAPELSVLCAQLVWTLSQLPGAPSVELLADGEPLRLEGGVPVLQSVQDWAGFDPEASPVDAVGHYIEAGALRLSDGTPAPGPAGSGLYRLKSAAVAADARTGELTSMVAVSDDGPVLLRGSYGGDLAPVLPPGGTLTTPTVAGTRGEFWTVRNGTEVVRVPAEGTPQTVSAPSLEALGGISVLQLSPDGVRAAVVGNGQLFVGTVVREEDAPVTLRDLRPVAPALGGVGDVAWSAADRLLVLASSGPGAEEGVVPYSVGVDGWGLSAVATAGLPGQPSTIAAAPSQQPLVSANGDMWQLSGGTWLTLVRGQQPFRGTEPFFPV